MEASCTLAAHARPICVSRMLVACLCGVMSGDMCLSGGTCLPRREARRAKRVVGDNRSLAGGRLEWHALRLVILGSCHR